MARHHNGGLFKICKCPRAKWSKCAHTWYLAFKWQGEYHRVSLAKFTDTPLTSKGAAESAADDLRTAIKAGRWSKGDWVPEAPVLPAPEVVRIRALADTYVTEHLRVQGLRSAEDEAARLTRAMDTTITLPDGTRGRFGELPASAVTVGNVNALVRARLLASQRKHCRCGRAAWETCAHAWHTTTAGGSVSVNRMLARLRALFNWALRNEYVTRTPFKGTGGVSTVTLMKERSRFRRLEDGEEDRLLASASPHLHAVIVAALETGCRKGELLNLTWSQVRASMTELHLSAEDTKAGRPRILPISNRLKAVLEMRKLDPTGEPHKGTAFVFGTDTGEAVASVNTAWRATCRRAEITGLTFHDLRREAGSRLLESGFFSVQSVRDFLDHSNISVTSRYLQTQSGGLKRAMRQWDASKLPTPPAEDTAKTNAPVPAASGEDAEAEQPAERLN